MRQWTRKSRGQKGQTTAEYALIVALVAISCIAIITIFSQQIQNLFGAETQQIGGNSAAQVQQQDITGKTNKGLGQF